MHAPRGEEKSAHGQPFVARTFVDQRPNPFPEHSRKAGMREKRVVFAMIILSWILMTETGVSYSPYLPAPSAVVKAYLGLFFTSDTDPTLNILFGEYSFAVQALYTFLRIYAAFTIGTVTGIAIGMLAGSSKRWGETFKGVVQAIVVTPTIYKALILIVGLPFIGPLMGAPGVVVIGSLAVFVTVSNTAYEIARDPEYEKYRESANALAMTKLQILFLIVLPIGKLPMIAALRTGMWHALGTTQFAELMMASTGLGAILITMIQSSRIRDAYALMLLGFVMIIPLQRFLYWLELRGGNAAASDRHKAHS